MRPFGSAKVLEARRWRALRLLKVGVSLNRVAQQIGCAASSVMRWRDALARGGRRAVKVKPTPGRPPKLSPRERRRLVRLLQQGAMAQGYRTELWTTQRIADMVETQFGVRYHRDHIGRLMHQLGWSHQRPERRALERDPAAIARWKRETWPRIKNPRAGWAPTSSSSTKRASS